MTTPTTLVWLRWNLRTRDNPPLWEAAQRGRVIPVVILPDQEKDGWDRGAASNVWLHGSLKSLANQMQDLGSPLILLKSDDPVATLGKLAQQTGADALYYDQRIEPFARQQEARLEQQLGKQLALKGWTTNTLLTAGQVLNGQGEPFRVFSPFWRAVLRQVDPPAPLPAPQHLLPPVQPINSLTVEQLGLLPPRLTWHHSLEADWSMGELAAQKRWQSVLSNGLTHYKEERNLPALDGTSRLSPHLHFGEISPRQLWHDLQAHANRSTPTSLPAGPTHFLSELGWREFAHQLLHFYPDTLTTPLQPRFAQFPWQDNDTLLQKWQCGQTGYPIVDAGMRQLWQTGWMHNRVRMIVGSFLVKHLLLSWQAGERWFWDTLVDADAANNTLGWQWIAGCGADAAPYFRIFNPMLQSEKFDAKGEYIRRWVPELANLPDQYIHQPWSIGEDRLRFFKATDYPPPCVDHAEARARALQAFDQVKA